MHYAMNKTVLLIGPNFHDFNRYVSSALEKLGRKVVVEAYDTPITPYTKWNKVAYKVSADKEGMRDISRMRFSEQAVDTFDKVHPQIVFLLNGEMLTPQAVQHFQKSAKVIVWFYDSITRVPHCWNIVPFCHKVFCYEQEDIRLIRDCLGIVAEFLPQAVDPSAYFNIPDVKKEWDIVFAADMWKSPKRMRLIQSVVDAFPEKKIRVWGIYKPWYKGFWRSVTRERRDIYTNRNTSSSQLNLDYNKARVVLNIHNEQQVVGANPKLYEISATGSYQVCDTNPYIQSLFQNSEVGLYKDEEELIEQIAWALDPNNDMEREQRAQQARTLILSAHTYECRMRNVLENI